MWPIAHLGMETVVCAKILGKQSLVTQNKIEAFDIMQFTGIYDKDGEEIYEGDIIADSSIELDEHGDAINLIVSFEAGSFCFHGAKEKGYANAEEFECKENKIDGYVMGNIYENPEFAK